MKSVLATLFLLCIAAPLAAQGGPGLTAPERSDYRETTRYDEAVDFMERAAAPSPVMHLTTFGYSMEGRPLPLAVVGHLPDGSPEAVRAAGRTVVYLQGNIHGGEVEGKEVLLMLLRDFTEGRRLELLDSLVLLVAPIFNADGNERVTLTNRGVQHGPLGGAGTRANAQGLNINRDHMKLDSPEGRSFVRLLRDYDPHLAMDLHTTNGTHHAYHLTYSPPLHPNVEPGVLAMARERIFPRMTENVRDATGWEYYFYGNVQGQGDERGWYTFDYRALFNNNYLGLRNRIGLLSEAYSYATFEDRITATRYFVDEALAFAHENATEIRQVVAAADAQVLTGQNLAVRAEFERSPEMVEILMGSVQEEVNPYSGATIYRRTEERRSEPMWEFGTFSPAVTERVPSAYLVPAEFADVLNNLEAHGVRMSEAGAPATTQGERFRITNLQVAERAFEGRHEHTIEGAWEPASVQVAAGTMRIDLDQPLGRLIFSLLEPGAGDGLATWGLLGEALEGAEFYPITRIP